MHIRLLLAALLVTSGVACKHNKQANETVRSRAMFDFACPKDDLTLRVADVEGARKLATQIAAYGCGKKAVYIYVPNTDTWIINGAVSEMPDDFVVPENITKGKDKARSDKKAAKAEKRGDMGTSTDAPAAPEPDVTVTPEPDLVEPEPASPDPLPDPS